LLESQRIIGCTFGGTELEWLFAATPNDVYRVQTGVKGALQY
jgi:hypothetical protein